MRRSGSRAGFTLVELLMVFVIIAILATIAIPRFAFSRGEAFRAAATSDLRNLANTQEIYWQIQRGYSADVAFLDMSLSPGIEITINEANVAGWSAQAVHTGWPSGRCGIYIGSADPAGADPATVVGEIACIP